MFWRKCPTQRPLVQETLWGHHQGGFLALGDLGRGSGDTPDLNHWRPGCQVFSTPGNPHVQTPA